MRKSCMPQVLRCSEISQQMVALGPGCSLIPGVSFQRITARRPHPAAGRSDTVQATRSPAKERRPRSPKRLITTPAKVGKIARPKLGRFRGPLTPEPAPPVVRYPSDSDRASRKCGLSLGDQFRPKCSAAKIATYSITSSASASNFAGNSTPIALAALRLSTNRNFVGRCTGRSVGFAPFKISPV